MTDAASDLPGLVLFLPSLLSWSTCLLRCKLFQTVNMSGLGITFGGIPTVSSWGPSNVQPRTHHVSTSKVCKKFKTKATKRRSKDKPDDSSEAHGPTSCSAKKRKVCEIQADKIEVSAHAVGTGDGVSLVSSKSTGVQLNMVDHLQPGVEKRVLPLNEHWELDSGFASEASPSSSGRCSPCVGSCRVKVVALDCEMVGTGPEGHCSELARCSVLNYDGDVLYDQYIQPRQPVTNYRTRWSGIRKQHLKNAVPFEKARTEIITLIKDKVVIGHALHNDFKVLGFSHPRHMIRDTLSSRALRQICGSPNKSGSSLKTLTRRLLNRNIQIGKAGHCSVEDAGAALDLYKLVEEQWEQDAEKEPRHPQPDPVPSLSHYMLDQYWPEHMDCSQ